MKIKFLEANGVQTALVRLIEDFEELHWAVAWGGMTPVTDKLINNTGKIRNVIFGVNFSQTHPDLVDRLEGIRGAWVATKFKGGTFHPKIYGFRTGKMAAAIIGSANFTGGGLYNNHEAATLVTGASDDPFFKEILSFTETSARDFGETVSREFAIKYRASCKRASKMKKPPRDPLDGFGKVRPAALGSSLLSMTWAEYVDEIQAGKYHNISESLELLGIAQKWFASSRSFSNLSSGRRKAVAGLIGERQKTEPDLDHDWGWFGSMKGMGDFANRVDQNDKYLALAIDCIPNKGEVSRDQYIKFVKLFRKAFRNSTRMGNVPTASRLLAMKRPDTFICLSKPNLREAADRMSFAPTTLDLDDYWDKVIEVIRLSDWYNSPKPTRQNGVLWDVRRQII